MVKEDKTERQPRTDCFGYFYKGNHFECCALNKLYCMYEDCKFYKHRSEVPYMYRGERLNGK